MYHRIGFVLAIALNGSLSFSIALAQGEPSGSVYDRQSPTNSAARSTQTESGERAFGGSVNDVSRTKRDIKTFEVRLRLDNADRRLAVGMTAYVVLPTV